MADRFWVGGTASWDATAGTKWAATSGGAGGEAVPTATDRVFFDAASGAVTVTVGASSVCDDLDFTGFTGTFAGSQALAVSGSLTLGAGMTRTYTGTITFNSTASETITSNGIALDGPLTFNGAGGAWALQDNLTTGATRTTTLTAGTLDLGAFDLNTGVFSSSNSNVRAVTGSGDIVLTNASGTTTVWTTSTATNLTTSSWTGTLRLTGANTSARTITAGSVLLNALSIEAGSGGVTLTNVNCTDLTFTSGYTGIWANAAITIRGSLSMNAANGTPTGGTGVLSVTGAGTLDFAGKVFDRPVTINAPGATVTLANNLTATTASRALTLTEGTMDLGAFDASFGQFISMGSLTRAIAGSGDMILFGTVAAGSSTVISMVGGSSNFTSSGWSGTIRVQGAEAGTRTLQANSTATPLPHISIEAGSGGVTTTGVSCASYTQTSGYTGVWSGSVGIRETLTLDAANGTPTAGGTISFMPTSGPFDPAGKINFAGKTEDYNVAFSATGVTFALSGAYTVPAARTTTLTAGTLDLGAFDLSTGAFSSSGSGVRAITGSGDILLTNASGSTTVFNAATGISFTLSGWTGTLRLTGGNSSSRTISGDLSPVVEFPAISVEAGSGIVTLSNVNCLSYTQTSGYTGSWGNAAAVTVRGSVTLDPANGTPASGTGTLTLAGTGTIDMAGKTFDRPITIDAPAGTVTLGDALNMVARALTLANGAFDQAAQAITCGSCVVNGTTAALASDLDIGTTALTFTAGTFDADGNDIDAGSITATGSGTRTIDLTGSAVTLANTGTAWDATGTNITLTTTGSTIECTDPDVTFAGGSRTYNTVRFARGGDIAITGSNTIATLALA